MQIDVYSVAQAITPFAFLGVVIKMYSNNGKVQIEQSKRNKNLYDYINKKADEGNKDHVHKDVYKSDIKNIEYRLDNIDAKQDKIFDAITKRNGDK